MKRNELIHFGNEADEIKQRLADKYDIPKQRINISKARKYLLSPEREIDIFLDNLEVRRGKWK